MEQLLAQQWLLGGENSGHIICCRDKVTTGDAIVAAMQMLAAMMREQGSVAELCAGMTLLPQTLVNIRFSGQAGQADPLSSPLVLSKVADVECELAEQGRVLLRKFGTEPLLRVMVEGCCAKTIARCAQSIAESVRLATV